MLGTNITIDDSTSGQLTISASGTGGSSTFLDLTDTPSTFGNAGQFAVINSAEDALEFVGNSILPGSPVYYSDVTSFSSNVLNITISELGTDNINEGDALIFLIPNSIPNNTISIAINGNPANFARVQDNEFLHGSNLRSGTYHALIRGNNNIYRLLSVSTEDWALFGNTDLIPNSKLDGLADTNHGWD